jgi:hypothetical protein
MIAYFQFSITTALSWLEQQEAWYGILSLAWFANRAIDFFLGLPAAFVCAVICWLFVDVLVPVVAGGTHGHLTALWSASPSLSAFITAIDQCGPTISFLVRTETALAVSIATVAFRVGDEIRKLIAVGERPLPSVLVVRTASALAICIWIATAQVAVFPVTAVPNADACDYATFDHSGSRW